MNEVMLSPMALERKEYNGQPVVTFKDIDKVHQRKPGTAKQNFNNNRKHFIEGVDYHYLRAEEIQKCKTYTFGIESPRGGMLLTQTGYLMIVKSFTDDLSWTIQRELVTGYFAGRHGRRFMASDVMTIEDYCRLTGDVPSTVKARLKSNLMRFGMGEVLLLEGKNLQRYNAQNPNAPCKCGHMYIMTRAGAERLHGMKR